MTSARTALAPLIVAARTPAQQRALAAELAQISADLTQRAEAQQRQQQRPPAQRLTPRSHKAGPGRAPSSFVRIAEEPFQQRLRVRLYVGRALWYALGSPTRLSIQKLGGVVTLTPARGDAGYAVVAGSGMPRAYCDGAAELLPAPGRYAADVRGGRIEIGTALA